MWCRSQEAKQNMAGHEIRVIVLATVTNRVADLVPLLGRALTAAEEQDVGEVEVVRAE
jgi:hypothetical protein